MAGNTRRAPGNGNLIFDSDPDDDTATESSFNTHELLCGPASNTLA
jgi:hypothetical protein